MPKLVDIMLVVTQHDRTELAFRRCAAHQPIDPFLRQHLIHGAQSVGAFGMPRWRGMLQARRMCEKERRHAISWRVERDLRGTAILEHDPGKWKPVFPRHERGALEGRSCSKRDEMMIRLHPVGA